MLSTTQFGNTGTDRIPGEYQGVTVSHPIAMLTLVRTRPTPTLVPFVAQGATSYGMIGVIQLVL